MFFLGHSWTGGYLIPGASEKLVINMNIYCDDFSKDFFEVHNISVAQNLTILEAILRFC